MHIINRIFSFLWAHKIISAIVLVILLIGAFLLRPKPAPVIATQTITYTDFTQTVSVNGSVAAKNQITLTFPTSGTISWIGFQQGDTVEKYQTIATLDQRTVLKNMQQSLLSYSLARNTFDQTIANNGNTQNPNDAVNDAEKRVLQDNQYNLEQAVNSVELANLAAQQSILTTPIAGIVTHEDVHVAGTTALAGQTGFTVVDPTSTEFDMDVDEADVAKVQLGQTAQINLDAYPNEVLSFPVASIDFTSHTTSNGGSAYTVAVKLPNTTNYKYRVGMQGSADIITAKQNNVLTIPLASLINNNQVYVQTQKGFVKRTLKLGLQNDTDAVVLSGLGKGDKIALDPTQVTTQ